MTDLDRITKYIDADREERRREREELLAELRKLNANHPITVTETKARTRQRIRDGYAENERRVADAKPKGKREERSVRNDLTNGAGDDD